MSLQESIDALLQYVNNEPILKEGRGRFYELDRAVWVAACLLKYEDKLPQRDEGEHLGKTNLPGNWVLSPSKFVPIGFESWKRDLLALRALADAVPSPDADGDKPKKQQTEDMGWSEAKAPSDWYKELGIAASTARRHKKEGRLIVDIVSTKLWRVRKDSLRRYKGD